MPMTVSLEDQIRHLALLASAENEDDVRDALLLIVRGRRLPSAVRRGFVNAVAALLSAAEVCQDISARRQAGGVSVDCDGLLRQEREDRQRTRPARCSRVARAFAVH